MTTEAVLPSLTLHPACDAFPSMQEEEWTEFLADVAKHGIRVPVLVHHGQILDGKHRWKAAQELGMACPTQEWNPGATDSVAALVSSLNRHRRHMTVGQKAAAAAELEPLYKEAAASRQRAGMPNKIPSDRNVGRSGEAIEHAAKAVGSSIGSAKQAKALKTADPEQFEAVKRGEKTLSAASRDSKQKPPPKRVKPAKPEPLIDKAGREYDDPKVIEALGQTGEFDRLKNAVHALKREILALAALPVGKGLYAQDIERDMENVATAIRFGTPYTTCPYHPNCKRGCACCGGSHWVTKKQWEAVPEDDRR